MLEIRPNCELCDKDLPPDTTEAMICTYECTFCINCVENILFNVCPNCAGGFSLRPIRPSAERREGVGLKYQPASTKRVNSLYSREEIRTFSLKFKGIAPNKR